MRKIFLTNILIASCIIYLAVNIHQVWTSPYNVEAENDVLKTPDATTEQVDKIKADNKIASLSSYDIIGKKNLFRPDRKEWTAPPPPPMPPQRPEPTRPEPPPCPPPDPLPEPILLGTVIEEDVKLALMQGHTREEISTPQVSRARPSRHFSSYRACPRYKITQEPMRNYHEGDIISEAKIIKILKDRVVLERESKVFQVLLRDPKKATTPASPTTPVHRRKPARFRR